MPTTEQIYDESHAELLRQLRNSVLMAGGMGLAGGAALSGMNWLQRSGLQSKAPGVSQISVQTPASRAPSLVGSKPPEEDEERSKAAAAVAVGALQPSTAKGFSAAPTVMQPRVPRLGPNMGAPGSNPLAAAVAKPKMMPKPAMKLAEEESAAGSGASWAAKQLTDAISGRHARSMLGMPLATPAMALALGGGVLAGDKLMDAGAGALNKRRREQEKQEAEQRYREALLSQYSTGKTASETSTATKLGQAMDTVFDFFERTMPKTKDGHEKLATLWASTVGDVPGAAVGLGLGTAALTGLGSGMAAYQLGKKHSGRYLLEEAVKERKRQLASRQTATIHANLEPVDDSELEDTQRQT